MTRRFLRTGAILRFAQTSPLPFSSYLPFTNHYSVWIRAHSARGARRTGEPGKRGLAHYLTWFLGRVVVLNEKTSSVKRDKNWSITPMATHRRRRRGSLATHLADLWSETKEAPTQKLQNDKILDACFATRSFEICRIRTNLIVLAVEFICTCVLSEECVKGREPCIYACKINVIYLQMRFYQNVNVIML